MAVSLRIRTLHYSLPSKPFSCSFLSSASSSHDLSILDSSPTQHNHILSANIKNKALHFLNCCKTSTHLTQIQTYLLTTGLFQDPSFSGRLLKLSTNLCEDLNYTFLIYKYIDFPDAFCVNTVIKNYWSSNYHEKAVLFYVERLRDSNFLPNSFTFPPLLSACGKLRCLRLGQMCQGQAFKFGVDSVLPVKNSLIHFYACFGFIDVVQKLLDEMPMRDVVTWNTMVDGFAKVGEMDVAHKLFDAMPQRNVVSWNAMMTWYLKSQNPGNALKLFREMMLMGFESNYTTVVNVLTACGRSNRLKDGRSVHGFLVKMFPHSSLFTNTAMVDMYSKCGRVDVAQVMFDRMPNKNLISWNTIILGHCIHGNPVDGLNLFAKMTDMSKVNDQLDEGNCILPDEITFIGVLCACARKGMLIDGRKYFSQMTDVFHVKPNFAHYWCLANLLAGVGLMQEAVDILRNIPTDEEVSPESSLWAELLGSCRFLGDVNLGEKIVKNLVEQNPQNFNYYNLLVNIYAVAGRWEEVARTKDVMKQRGIGKVACCNLKDLKEIVHGVKLQKDLQLTW